MPLGAVDNSGKFTPEYAAYTKLTLVNRVQREVNGYGHDTKKSITFESFLEAIKKEQILNHDYARNISLDEVKNNAIYSRNAGDLFTQNRFSTLEKAYELGLVDANGILISSFEARA